MDRVYTAWELCGDWWWTGEYYARTVGGHTDYWEATASNTEQSVRLSRIATNPFRQINRYVPRDTEMILVLQAR